MPLLFAPRLAIHQAVGVAHQCCNAGPIYVLQGCELALQLCAGDRKYRALGRAALTNRIIILVHQG